MSMCNVPLQAPIGKIPKDGVGPKGVPECYYVSRVLNSTFRYVKFVKRLRAQEEEQRKGAENNLKALKDQQQSDFFLKCDRKSLINNVSRRVDLCMQSYEMDMNKKRQRLLDLFSVEEEQNIRKFVEQMQAGAEALWQDKQDRLKYLLEKRRKEHEEKYKDTPLSKCVHVLACVYNLRAKEATDIHKYQMKEKEARKMAEKERDRMWHEVAMKESEALKARMEFDAMERYRKDLDCKLHSEEQMEQNRKKREREKEILKEETRRFRIQWEEDNRKAEEAEQQKAGLRRQMMMEINAQNTANLENLNKIAEQEKFLAKTWESLTQQGLNQEKEKMEIARRKEKEHDECNRVMTHLKNEVTKLADANDDLIHAEAAQTQKKIDEKRCAYLSWSQKTNRDVRKAMIDQIKDREEARQDLKAKLAEQDLYHEQLFQQLTQLNKHKELDDARKRKDYQNQLIAQIEYNKVLKERARKEEEEQYKKWQIASEEYQNELHRMLCRPKLSDEVHPFMRQMDRGLKMKPKCPCSKPDYCQH